MFPPASSEFVILCRSQIDLLTQRLGASWSAVYLMQDLQEESHKLVPIVIDPETTDPWQQDQGIHGLVDSWEEQQSKPKLLMDGRVDPSQDSSRQLQNALSRQDSALHRQRQVVLPLIHEGVVLGLLVTRRDDRSWNSQELEQIQNIVTTLTLACLLDQRQEWYKGKFQQEQHLRQLQQSRLDDILHQLRNPLTALRTFSKLLLKRLLPGDRNQQVVKSLVLEGDRLRDLLQQFEDWSHQTQEDVDPLTLNTYSVKVSPDSTSSSPLFLLPGESFPLDSLSIQEILEPLIVAGKAIATERGLEFEGEIPGNLGPIRGNAQALREVLSNLIDNALKYTPSGGKIQIIAGIERDNSTGLWQGISIYNSGPGIPRKDQERIFERHYRGVQEQSSIEGSGLGLAIAKELIEQMQGEIELLVLEGESGTKFMIWLPLRVDD